MTRQVKFVEDTRYGSGSRSGSFIASAVLHVALGAVLTVLPKSAGIELRQLQYSPEHDTITYVPTSKLPAVRSSDGAQRGAYGAAGARQSFRPTQAIRVARGGKIQQEIVQTPHLNLPTTDEALADLLAFGRQRSPKLAAQPLRVAGGRSPMAQRRAALSAPTIRPSQTRNALRILMEASKRPPKLPVAPAEPIRVREETTTARLREEAAPLVPGTSAAPALPDRDPGLPVGSAEPIKVREETRTDSTGEESAPAVAGRSTAPGLPDRSYGEGVVLSPMPGSKLATREVDQPGSTAMSFTGGREPGVGTSGTGGGIARGSGPGAAKTGVGPGSADAGSGRGADKLAEGGITPKSPEGGAGRGTGNMSIAGLSIAGGATAVGGQIFVGSFGPAPSVKRSLPLGPRKAPPVLVTGTSRSGGVLQRYAKAPRGNVSTIYISTGIGTAVVEFSEASNRNQAGYSDLTAPEPLQASLPNELSNTPIVVGCLMDRSGRLKEVTLLHEMAGGLADKLIAALASWRFRPVLRGDEPVEASVLIGMHLK